MSSNTGYIMTLANTIIGVVVVAMPFCFQRCGILLSIVLLIFSNLITRFSCYYLLKSSLKARRKNFEFLASSIFGSSGKLMVELCLIGYLMGSCITYFVVVGDLGPQIIAKLFNISHSDSLRTFIMIIVTLFCIIPLCLLKNIESLSAICISSILFYFCLVLKIFFESENKMMTTYWYDNVYWWRPSGITQCLPIFSMALSCQPQIFDIYESLPNPTIDRMSNIIKHGINICTGVYICVGFFGYIAFYDQPYSGNVLLNLSSSYMSDIIQMGFVLSVAVSFPLVLFPCRASLYSLLYHRSHSETSHYIPEHRFKYITISMVLVALTIGILIPSIELIIGLVGSTIGITICIMFPASCFIKINKKNSTEKLAAQFLLIFGFVIMILGTYANLYAIDEQQSRADIPIEHLPNIHVDNPTENILNVPYKFENSIKEEIGPKKPIDAHYERMGKLKVPKRKLVKPPQSLPIENDDIREINLNEKEKNEMNDQSAANVESFVQKDMENNKPDNNSNGKISEKLPDTNVVPNQLAEPTTVKKSIESAINNEAIKKEDQEIEIEEQEKDDERTKEILAKVKNVLDKQNQKNQKVLDQINKISEKVNNLEEKNMEPKKSPDNIGNDKVILHENEVAQQDKIVSKSNDIIGTVSAGERSAPVKNPALPPIPVVKLLAERNPNPASIPLNLNESNKRDTINDEDSKIEKPNKIVEEKVSIEPLIDAKETPPRENKLSESVGRDLLSNSNDFRTMKTDNAQPHNDQNET